MTLSKLAAGSALFFAALVLVFCPCAALGKCHLAYVYGAILVALLVIVAHNGLSCTADA